MKKNSRGADGEAPRKPYRKPRLKRLGALESITRGNVGSIPDTRRGAHRKGRR